MNRTRYGCRRKIEREPTRYVEPAVLMQCPRCDEFLRTVIAELIQLSKDEYARGMQDGARLALDTQKEER